MKYKCPNVVPILFSLSLGMSLSEETGYCFFSEYDFSSTTDHYVFKTYRRYRDVNVKRTAKRKSTRKSTNVTSDDDV